MRQAGPSRQMLKRMFIVMLAVIIGFVSVTAIRLVDIMLVNGSMYQSKASAQQLHDAYITAERGSIYDANMKVLAKSDTVWTVYVTPNDIARLDAEKASTVKNLIADNISSILKLDRNAVMTKLSKTGSYYVELKKKVREGDANRVREFIKKYSDYNLGNYIGIDESTTRSYSENIAASVLGFVGDDNQGLSGLEKTYDEELTGVAGRVVAAKNAVGADMPFSYEKIVDAKPGNSLVLTIDSYIQYVAEKYLDAAIINNQVAERGCCVIMNVKTGGILAMATKGDFDCNSPFTLSAEDQAIVDELEGEERTNKLAELRNRQWRNKIVSDAYEPGSVFKVITAAIGIEEGFTDIHDSVNCPGYIVVAGQRYSCHKKIGHGTQNLTQATQNSCNPFFISLGQKIGVNTFFKYFKAFGFTEKTGIDLIGEASSQYHKKENMGPTELASTSFGQTFKVTPIQLITAVSAAVNGGKLLQPRIVDKIIDAEGNIVKSNPTVVKRQVISEETSALVRSLMEAVVDGGGGQNAYVPGYRIGGKTGTSQKVSEMLASGERGLYVASFCGVAPIDDPEIAMLFILDEPKGANYYGGTISAPPGGQILAEILPYLGYEPQYSEDEINMMSKSVPNFAGIDVNTAKNQLTSLGLTCKIVGEGDKVSNQLPVSGSTVYTGGVVVLYTDDNAEKLTTTVPSFDGLSPSQVNTLAVQYGINVSFKGNTASSKAVIAYMQSIPPDAVVNTGTVVEVHFRSNETGDIGG